MLDPAPKSKYLATPNEWTALGQRLLTNEEVNGIDTETIGCNPRISSPVGTARVVLWSVAVPGTVLHPRGYRKAEGYVLPPVALDNPEIRRWIESPRNRKVAHNGRYDRHSLRNEGVDLLGLVDTVDIYRIISPGRERYGLKDLVPDVLNQEIYGKFETLFSVPCYSESIKKYKVCVVHGRSDSNQRKYCEHCPGTGKNREELVVMTEIVRKELVKRAQVPLQDICDVPVHTTAWTDKLEIRPNNHPMWPLLVDYAGADAIWACELYQCRANAYDGLRQARIPIL